MKKNRKIIRTDEDFESEAIVFFEKELKYHYESRAYNFRPTALAYVKKLDSGFRYKDDVEADILISILVKKGYLEFFNSENGIQYHSLTKKGLDYISKINENER